jgi:hypothetical protein
MSKIRRAKLTDSILRKWREQGYFIRHLDNNTMNNAISNLQQVSLKDALNNMNWTTDWDIFLSKRERELVMDPQWREGLTFTPKTPSFTRA